METITRTADAGRAAPKTHPALVVGHSTLAARDLDGLVGFYCDTLGFQVTNRGFIPDGKELVFLCQDPTAHHQIVVVGGAATGDADFVMVDHLALRTNKLDDLRIIKVNLQAAGIEKILQIDHGNAWSLYFNDPEGNGVECYVDTPFHVAQPYAGTFDIDMSDEAIERTTQEELADKPEFQPMKEWQANFARRLGRSVPN